jgi:hypothetical protein
VLILPHGFKDEQTVSPQSKLLKFVLVYIMVHIYVNKNVCLSGHLDNLIAPAEELDILREPNDI